MLRLPDARPDRLRGGRRVGPDVRGRGAQLERVDQRRRARHRRRRRVRSHDPRVGGGGEELRRRPGDLPRRPRRDLPRRAVVLVRRLRNPRRDREPAGVRRADREGRSPPAGRLVLRRGRRERDAAGPLRAARRGRGEDARGRRARRRLRREGLRSGEQVHVRRSRRGHDPAARRRGGALERRVGRGSRAGASACARAASSTRSAAWAIPRAATSPACPGACTPR